MGSGDQAARTMESGVQLNEIRTLRMLRRGAPAPDAVRRLSDRALRVAAFNPDHSEAGRVAVAEELRTRHISLEPWRVRVPTFICRNDLARGDALFFGGRETLLRVTAWGAVMAALVSAGLLALGSTGAGWAVATALSLLLARVVAVWLRLKPARLCLVMPTASPLTRAPLRRAIRSELSPYGHVFAFDQRDGWIRSAAGYRACAQSLRDLLALNQTRQPVPVSASNDWRPLALRLLADSSDAILVDLSDGASWALPLLREEIAAGRCVFVAIWGKAEEGEALLRAAGITAPCFAYAPDGEIQQRPRFRAAIFAALRATHHA